MLFLHNYHFQDLSQLLPKHSSDCLKPLSKYMKYNSLSNTVKNTVDCLLTALLNYCVLLHCKLIAVQRLPLLGMPLSSWLCFTSSNTIDERPVTRAVSFASCCGFRKQSSLIFVFNVCLQTPLKQIIDGSLMIS